MVALPAMKFVMLGIRQLTKPVVKQVVTHASTKRGITYTACIWLGRVSLGLSGVIAEWSRTEVLKNTESPRKLKEEQGQSAGTDAEHEAKRAIGAEEAAPPEGDDTPHVVHLPASIVTPRSRSLLTTLTYGPPPKEDTYDVSVFVDPKRTVGEAARVFIRHPYRSTWFVFRMTFLAPFPAKRLVSAGAELLIELLAYTVLAMMLFFELRQQFAAAAAKEAHLQARLEAIEEKLNHLVRISTGTWAHNVSELPPTHKLEIVGRLHSLRKMAATGYKLFEGLVLPHETSAKGATNSPGTGRTAKEMRITTAPPPDPTVKRSKHDETVLMKDEIEASLKNLRTPM